MDETEPLKRYAHNLRVLYVDDEELLRSELMRALSRYFTRVDGAANGEEGLEKYKENAYDIVISDVRMPKMDGIEFSRRVKFFNPLQHIIVISAYDDAQDLVELINLGVDQFVQKPVTLNSLKDVLERVCLKIHEERSFKKKVITDVPILEFVKQASFEFGHIEEGKKIAGFLGSCTSGDKLFRGLLALFDNAVHHGNLKITYDETTLFLEKRCLWEEIQKRHLFPENQNKKVSVTVYFFEDRLDFLIKDEGQGFDFEKYLVVEVERVFDNHGLGIAMSKLTCFDELQYLGKGNIVKASIKR